jgi:methyl-accepting chemotaxis protein
MSVYNIDKDRKWSLIEASKLVAVSGKNLVAALTFLDAKAVESILLPVFADEDVLSIKVYDADADLFVDVAGKAKHISVDSKIELRELDKEKSHISYNHIEIVSPIRLDDEIIGFIEIIKSTDKIKERLKAQFLFSMFVVLITLIIIFILSFWFEKLFSNPIYFLLNAMREIQKSGNYSVNIISKSKDEFNELYNEFNHMIDQICSRDRI